MTILSSIKVISGLFVSKTCFPKFWNIFFWIILNVLWNEFFILRFSDELLFYSLFELEVNPQKSQ